MEKFVPYAKLSKKARRRADREKRQTWAISPVTRRPENPKAYKRKTGPVTDDGSAGLFFKIDRSATDRSFLQAGQEPAVEHDAARGGKEAHRGAGQQLGQGMPAQTQGGIVDREQDGEP